MVATVTNDNLVQKGQEFFKYLDRIYGFGIPLTTPLTTQDILQRPFNVGTYRNRVLNSFDHSESKQNHIVKCFRDLHKKVEAQTFAKDMIQENSSLYTIQQLQTASYSFAKSLFKQKRKR